MRWYVRFMEATIERTPLVFSVDKCLDAKAGNRIRKAPEQLRRALLGQRPRSMLDRATAMPVGERAGAVGRHCLRSAANTTLKRRP